jgi:hypothetical protein
MYKKNILYYPMELICKKLHEYKPVFFNKTKGPSLHVNDYDCPDSVKKTLGQLKKSDEYTWGSNKVTFYHNEQNCDVFFHYIARLLSVIQPKNKPVTAIILLSSAKKYYPKEQIFGPDHVNTGYANNEHIVIYRKEEWFKVFIHECFHFFHYDGTLFEPSLQDDILKLFKVKSDVNLYESYCEIWARTLNCCMVSVINNLPVSIFIEREKKYSVRHMVNVLRHMQLTYDDLFRENTFHENTNVLAYVVIGALLMHHDFLSIYMQDKSIDTMFHLTNPREYVQFIYDHCKSKSFLDMIHHTEKNQAYVTTTMSIVSL